ncbi:murein biosynthesis integral membrane protein MurJ [Anoxybacillus gonensis]|uniref:murein biosynthesis integral membrane protein MurJ n=1 Tax=Anoxybacillus gonensis TaxID=198467 RepID=UPI0002BF0525|nr:murein biosynthesis integral membrane protein MurJ [Anoxybacillus gonensis]EMI10452.1 integral membrane protein MviN [Anoxybacillus gonensis]
MGNRLVKAGAFIFIVTLISKILGFLRETLIAYRFGTSLESDAYFVALTPSMLAVTFSMSLSSVFLPMFIKHCKNKKEGFLFSNRVLVLFFSIFVLMYMLILLRGDVFVSLMAPGMTEEGKMLAAHMLKILFPLSFLVIAIQIYTVMLNSFDQYFLPSASILPNNLLIILYLLLFGDTFGIFGVSYVTFIAFFIQFIILYWSLNKLGYSFRVVHFFDVTTKEFMILLMPLLVSTMFSQFNAIVDRLLASTLEEGSISALMYSYKLRTLILGVFVTSIISVTAPKISRLVQQDELDKVGTVTRESVLSVFLFMAPLTWICMLFSEEIIHILFERGEFDQRATILTSKVFFYSSVAILAASFRDIVVRTFYAFGDTKTPTNIIILSLIFNMVSSYIFVKMIGLPGLGLSLSLAVSISAWIITLRLNKLIPNVWKFKSFYTDMIKILICSLVPAFAFILIKKNFSIFHLHFYETFVTKFIFLISCFALYYFIFVLLLLAFKVEILTIFMRDVVLKKIKKDDET